MPAVDVQALAAALAAQLQAQAAAAPVAVNVVGAQAPALVSAQSLGVSWEDYCLLDPDDLPEGIYRPFLSRSISLGTLEHEERILRQIAAAGIPLDPPDWEFFMGNFVRTHKRGKACLDNHRRAYLRRMWYYGIPTPPNLHKGRWDHEKAKGKAKEEGRMRSRIRFFRNNVLDILRLLQASPLRTKEENDAFHHLVTFNCLAAPRGSEPNRVTIQQLDGAWRTARDLFEKKKSTHRGIVIPEPWFWDGPGPTHKWYVTRVRPALLERNGGKATDAYALNYKGKPFPNDAAYRNWMARCIREALGYAIGPHAFRRFCATIRYIYGWSIAEIATFLNDEERQIENHYIDYDLVELVGRRNLNRGPDDPKPILPPFWNMPKDLGLPEIEFDASAVA